MKYKIFKERASLYDHLVQTNPYIYGIYQACKVQSIVFLVYLIFRDSYKAGRPWLDFSTDAARFGHVSGWLVFLVLEMFLLVIFVLLYPVFLLWKFLRMKMGVIVDLFYFLFMCSYVVLSIFTVYKAISMRMMGSIPRASAFIECTRVIFKAMSFVRENGYKVLYPWSKDDEQGPPLWYGGQMSPKVASFSQYMYFLVAPTLLYRDYYPRNKGDIKWSNVAAYSIQVWMVYLVSKELYDVQYPKSFKIDDLAEMYQMIILVSPAMYFLASISLLHAMLNLIAELTRFADREFYLNWWSAWGYTEYYRLWNVPIHDFTTFLYGTLKLYLPRALAGLLVLTFSAFIHDFFISVALGFFLPVFLILFALLGGLMFAFGIKYPKYLLFLNNCLGYVLFQGAFYTELAARDYCPDPDLSYFTVHSLHCLQQRNNLTISLWW